jgi:RNA polymerase sigma factor (sigma-70 family)
VADSRAPNWAALFSVAGKKPRSDIAWSELYLALWPYLLDWIISRYGLGTYQAEDVLQDALLQYRTKLLAKEFAEPSLPHALAFVRYCALGYLRRESRFSALEELEPPLSGSVQASKDPERELLQKLIVDEALERLDQRCSYALRAKYIRGLTSAEIGLTLRMRVGAVDTLLHRCRAACRDLIISLRAQMEE